MHKAFQPFLREDGNGIDYSQLENYDTRTVLENYLLSQHPYWIKELEDSIDKKAKNRLSYAIQVAKRIGLDKKNPELLEKATKCLYGL